MARRLIALAAALTLTACASTCPPPPDPPVWALSTVPDEATFEQQVLYLLAENAQREAWGDTLYAHILECRR